MCINIVKFRVNVLNGIVFKLTGTQVRTKSMFRGVQ